MVVPLGVPMPAKIAESGLSTGIGWVGNESKLWISGSPAVPANWSNWSPRLGLR